MSIVDIWVKLEDDVLSLIKEHQMIEIWKHPTIKRTWIVKCKGRTFDVSSSQFGWHINEWVADEYKRHVFGLVFDSKKQCLAVIKEAVIGGCERVQVYGGSDGCYRMVM